MKLCVVINVPKVVQGLLFVSEQPQTWRLCEMPTLRLYDKSWTESVCRPLNSLYQNANSTTVGLYYCVTAATTATTAIIIITASNATATTTTITTTTNNNNNNNNTNT
jgi:hypothetical protein